jgi:casein kinase II subunit beta
VLFQVYPALVPAKSARRYEPKIFGFKVHAAAALARWQADRREEMKDRLRQLGVQTHFEEEDGELESEEDEEDEDMGAEEFDRRGAVVRQQ